MEKFNKKGVQIFSTGKWNDSNYTLEDLNDMVISFDATKAGINPHLKLGHNKEQELLKKDGLPAAGYIDRVYVQGEKLYADFTDIPRKIYKLLEAGAYKKVSIEMFSKVKIKGQEFKNLITAVALLGADTPGVMDLDNIMEMYETDETPISYELEFTTITRKESDMPTKEELRAEIEAELKAEADAEKASALEAQLKEFAAKDKSKEEELATLKQFKADAEKKAIEDALKVKEAEVKTFVTGLKADKLCSVAMEPIITQLLSDDVKEFSVKDKKATKEEALKEVLVLFKALSEVNFEESSTEGEKDKSSETEIAELHKEALEFAAKEKTSYGQALIKVKQSKKKGK